MAVTEQEKKRLLSHNETGTFFILIKLNFLHKEAKTKIIPQVLQREK